MTIVSEEITSVVLAEIAQERLRQFAKFGEQNPPDGTGSILSKMNRDAAQKQKDNSFANGMGTWGLILNEEFWEALAERNTVNLRAELIQVAAVAVAWVEAIDRRSAR